MSFAESFLITCFVCHFVADFLLQSRDIATRKSSEFRVLIKHLWVIMWVPAMAYLLIIVLMISPTMIFLYKPVITMIILNALVHGVIDWNIWKMYKTFVKSRFPDVTADYKYWEDHWFYATIGLDQLLHALTIIVLYFSFFS